MSDPKPSFHPSPSRPKLRLPAGACDAHVHVFGPHGRFPFEPERPFTPADAPKEKLFALHAAMGIERCVIVQSTCHGFDNSVVADAIAAKNGEYCGVALLPVTVTDVELRRLDALGFCGVRFNFMQHLGKGARIEDAIALTNRLAGLGWHLQVHCESSLIAQLSPWLKRSAVSVVIDHMGRVDSSLGVDQPAFRALLELMRDERFLVKVSGAERNSRQDAPWEDSIPFARALIEEFPKRTFWGTDWPHPNLPAVPDDGVLVDLLSEIAPSEQQRQALLVDNPKRFYGFPRKLVQKP
ncbi:MAG: amidohydrolase family protein [Betaproteobacteria bacterium]|nr:amidohydrolase family protein [Betaproteobacteria bacterium]